MESLLRAPSLSRRFATGPSLSHFRGRGASLPSPERCGRQRRQRSACHGRDRPGSHSRPRRRRQRGQRVPAPDRGLPVRRRHLRADGGLSARGFVIVIASNQSGIGRGYYTEADFERLMGWMKAEFARRGVAIAGVYHCPDHPTEGVGRYRRANPWRKPGPGMLLQAARDLDLDLARSWTVGDKMTDIEAGRAAGVGTLVRYDPLAPAVARCQDFWVVPRLEATVELLAKERG